MEQLATASKRLTAREIGTDGMMMHYSDPQIIKEQVAALKNLGLIGQALESIDVHNPVLAAAIRSDREHFIDYEQMKEEPVEYSYEGFDGHGYISSTYTWVALLHYELQTVALFGLMEILEHGELRSEQIVDFTVALGDTTVQQNAFLAFNYNPARQPKDFFDSIADRMISEGFGVEKRGYNSFYSIPAFLWSALDAQQRGRLAGALLREELNSGSKDFEDQVLRRKLGSFLATIFAWNRKLNSPGLTEGISHSLSFDYGDRFAQGRVEFTEDGFLWIEELRGLNSAR